MIEISLCMIVKNEEKILTRCLDSVADLVDEVWQSVVSWNGI